MKKVSLRVILFISVIFSMFFATKQVNAAGYGMTPVAYNVTTVCDLSEYYVQDCFNELIQGNYENYLLTNNTVEPGMKVMVAFRLDTPGTSSVLGGFQAQYNFDINKLTVYGVGEDDNPGINRKTIYYDYGVVPVKPKKDGSISPTAVSTWTLSNVLEDKRFYMMGDMGDDALPVTRSGYVYGIVIEIPESATPGSSITLEAETSPAIVDYTSVDNVKLPFTLNELTLNVLSDVSTDGTLKELHATGTVGSNTYDYLDGKFSPSDKTNLTYEITVPNSVTSLAFTGTPTDTHTTGITGLNTTEVPTGGIKNLNVGDNIHNITIVAESGDSTIYKINIKRLSDDATLSSISGTNSVSFPTITSGTTNYSLTVPYKTSSTFVTANPTHTNATIDSGNGSWTIPVDTTNPTNNKVTNFPVKVKAENCNYTTTEVPGNTCTELTYNFAVTRTAASRDVTLADLRVDGIQVPEWSPTKYEYTLDNASSSKTSVNITATVNDSLNRIESGTGVQVLNVGDNKYKVIVKSESLEENIIQEYVINIRRLSSSNTLQNLTVNQVINPIPPVSPTLTPSFGANKYEYSYTYNADATGVTISATVHDIGNAKIKVLDTSNSSNPIEIVAATLNTVTTTVSTTVTQVKIIVLPEDPNVSAGEYIIDLKRQTGTDNYLSSLTIDPGTINETFKSNVGSYTATVDANVTSVNVNAVLSDPKARIVSITGNSGFQFGPGNIITVTVQNETGKNAGDDTTGINTYTINVTRKKYDIATLADINVGFGTSAKSSIISNFVLKQDESGVDYYEAILYQAASPLPYTTSDMDIDFTLTNEYSTFTSSMNASYISGNTYGKDNVAVNTGDNTYTISVKSHDEAKTLNYVIKVYRQKNTDNTSGAVTVANVQASPETVPAGETPKHYYVTLPNNKETIVPSEVVIGIPTGATLQKNTSSLTLSTQNDNIFNYSITSENGVTENYVIHITRTKSNNADMTTVYLRIGSDTSRSCVVSPATEAGKNPGCTIEVPVTTTAYYLEPTIHSSASLSPDKGTIYTMNPDSLTDSIQERNLTVTAEDSTQKTYTITVKRALSADATLKTISLTDITNGKNSPISGYSPIVIRPSDVSYNVTVTGDVEEILVAVEKNDLKASVTTDLTQPISLSYGINKVQINTIAENGTTTGSYVLNITRNKKIDATLKDLQVNSATLTNFIGSNTSYTYPVNGMNLPYNTTSLNILAHVNDDKSIDAIENAIVQSVVVRYNNESTPHSITITPSEEVTASIPLATGKNEIEIEVAAQDRAQTKKYTITVNRSKNNDASIEKVEIYYDGTFHEATKEANGTYTITVPNNVNQAFKAETPEAPGAVRVTPRTGATINDPVAMWTVVTTPLETLDSDGNPVANNVLINVTPEEGSMVPYTLIVTRTPSSVKDMSSLNIYTNAEPTVPKACIFKNGNIECSISAETSTTQITMEATLVDPKSSVSYSDGITTGVDGDPFNIGPTDSQKTITATVQAEDGTTKEYTILIKRQASSDAYLKFIKTNANQTPDTNYVTIDGFTRESTSYINTPIYVPGITSSINIEAETNDARANIIKADGVTLAANTKNHNFTKNLVYGNNDVEIEVLAEDGTTRLKYTIRIVRNKNIDATLANLHIETDSMSGTIPNFNKDTILYPATGNFNVDYDETNFNLYAIVSDEDYAKITNISYNGTYLTFEPNKEINTAIPLSTGNNEIVITVTAHDQSVTKNYTVNIARTKNNDASISKVEVYYDNAFHDAIWNEAKSAYEITVPYNTLLAQNRTLGNNGYVRVKPNSGATSSDPLATVTMNDTQLVTNDPVNENVNTHKFTVEAEDGTTQEYTMLITRTKNDKKALDRVNVYKDGETSTNTYCTFNAGVYSCDISLPVGTNSIKLEGLLSSDSTGAEIDYIDAEYNFGPEFTLGNNSSVVITALVTAEDGSDVEYTINISRAKSSTSTLEYIKTDAGSAGTLALVADPFNPVTQNYTVTVPYNQSDLIVEAKTLDAKAKVTIFKVTTGLENEIVASDAENLDYQTIALNGTGSSTIIKVVVEPETGAADKRVYTITVNRGLNEEPRLTDITIGGQSINNYLPSGVTFSPDGREYELEMFDYEVSSLLINGINMDTQFGTIKVGDSNATPAAGVTVEIQTVYYNQTLPVSLPVTNPYINTIIVKGVAQNTNVTKEYILKIKRKPSLLTDITGVGMNYDGSFHPATCDLVNLRCSITVPNSVTVADSGNVVVTPANGILATDKIATVSMNSTTLVTNDETNGNVNNHEFTITAEDGTTTKDYTLVITREKSDNAVLNSILVYDSTGTNVIGSFNPSYNKNKPERDQVYTVVVPVTTTEFKVFAEPEYPYVTVTGATLDPQSIGANGKYTLTESTRQVIVTSRSEDGSKTIAYTLNIQRVSNSNYLLGNLIITGEDGENYIDEIDPAISDSNDTYTVRIPGNVSYVDLTVKPQSPLATVGFDFITVVDPENKIDGVNPDGDSSTSDARFYIPTNTTKVANFIIISEAGGSKPYKLNIIREPRKDATLKTLAYTLPGGETEILDLATDPTKRDFVITTPVDNNVTGINISARANDDQATVSGHVGDRIIATGPNTYTITVTAEDGQTTEDYTISIERRKNSDATLSVLSVNGYTFNELFVPRDPDHIHYTMNVDTLKETIGPDDIIATPTKTTSKAVKDPEINLSKITPTTYNITVTAEDGVTKLIYTITITRPLSTDCFLKDVKLTGATIRPAFNKDTDSYTIIVPYGSTNFTMTSEPNASTSTVSTNGNGTHNLSEGNFVVTVTAENGDTKDYSFNIIESPSNDGKLTSLSVTNHTMTPTFVGTTFDYSIGEVENTFETLEVNAVPSNANSEIQYIHNGVEILECHNLQTCNVDIKNTSIGETKPISVKITPPAGEAYKTEYTLTYKRVRSKNAYLSDIIPSVGTLNNVFNPGTLTYELNVPYENDSVDITFIADNHMSSLEIDGNTAVSSPKTVTYDNLPDGGTKNVVVKVIAEDGETNKVYNITIKRAANEGGSDAFLSALEVVDYPFIDETFKYDDFDYSIGQIPYQLATLTINATPNDADATIEYYLDGTKQTSNVINISNINQTITVKVTSANGQVDKSYSIAYTKVAKTNNNLSSIVVSGGELSPQFAPDTLAYTVNVGTDVNSIDITAITADASATLKFGSDPWVSGKVHTVSNLKPGANIVDITVTAENGDPKVYRVTINKESETEIITSVNFGHSIDNDYILTVAAEATALDMKNQLDNDNVKLQIWTADDTRQLADNENVGTGMIVKLIVNNELLDSKVIIIKGDTDGDGTISTFDSADLLNHYLGRTLLQGPYFKAGDTDGDNDISTFDSADVLNHYLGRTPIVFLPRS